MEDQVALNLLLDLKVNIDLIIQDDYYYHATPEIKQNLVGSLKLLEMLKELEIYNQISKEIQNECQIPTKIK